MNKFLLLIICSFSWIQFHAQILKNTTLNLNTNGRIYDMAYIPTANAYVVVGDFTSIGGYNRKNLAYIDATTLSVIASAPTFSFNGVIRTVEYHTKLVGMVTHHYLTIGGSFTTIGIINGASVTSTNREALALFYTTGSLTGSNLSNLTLFNWNYRATNGLGFEGNGVFDLLSKGDTLLVGGVFQGINLASAAATSVNNSEDNFLALSYTPATASHFTFVPTTPNLFPINDVGAFSLLYQSGKVFVGGLDATINNGGNQGVIKKYTTNLSNDATYISPSGAHGFHSLYRLNDSLFLGTHTGTIGTSSLASALMVCKIAGTTANGTAQYPINPLLSFFSDNVWGHTSYNEDLLFYKGNTATLQRHRLGSTLVSNGLNFTQIGSSIAINSTSSHVDSSNNLFVAGRYLFLSESGITNAGGQLRTGVAIFCLEPENPKAFTNPDLSVCPGETVTYTIPDVNYETGYKWTYSGTGIQYSVNNGAFQNYTGPVMNTTANASSIKLRFANGATGGTLTVEPYNTCNTASDYLYAKSQSITITLNPIPNITLNADTLRFTCAVDSLTLVAQTTAPSATFQWFYPNAVTNVSINDTLNIHASGSGASAIYPTGKYYVMVTNLLNGCKNTDSLHVQTDLVPPTISQDSLHTVPAAFTCSTAQMQLFASAGNATVYWTTASDALTQLSNPHTIYSIEETDFIAHAISNSNGCQASQQFSITKDTATAAGYLPGYPGFLMVSILDTVDCYQPQLSLLCGVQPTDPVANVSSAYWISSGSTNLSLSESDAVNLFNQTRTYSFVTLNEQNDCRDTFEITLLFDFGRPFVIDYTPASQLNCSVDTATIMHPQTGGAVTEGWLDGTGNPTGIPNLFIQAAGDYIYEVQYTGNGCKSYDTVSVIQSMDMLLTGTSDTIICPGDHVTLTSLPVHIDESVSYEWSNGATSHSVTATGGIDNMLIVTVTSASGCVGRDTIQVSITDPVQIETAGFISCGASKGSLQITQATGGAGSYQYSMDGISFSANPFFDSLPTGIHSLFVKDALGCIYAFQDTLDANASAPAMDFLVSTYSGFGDTLAIVNTTLYAGFDATDWSFPSGTHVIYQSDSLALVQLPDTGWFEITLIGYDDTCQFTFSKSVYYGAVSPNYPTYYDSVKIQSLIAHPNPTSGSFTLDLVFGTAQDYVIMITNSLGQPIPGMQQSGTGKILTLPFAFPENTPPGSYHIHVVSDYDSRQFTLILN